MSSPVIFSAMQDPTDLFTGNANGYISGQIFYDVFQARYGSGQGGVVAMGIPLIGALGCGALSVASNSRCPGSLDVLRSLHVFSRLPLNLTSILSLQALFPLVDHAMSTAKEFCMAPLGCTLSVFPSSQHVQASTYVCLHACRMLWSFSRDGGVPFHRIWSSVNPLTGTPINSVWSVAF